MTKTSFLQVADNAESRIPNNSLRNTTTPITISGFNTASFPVVTTGYIITIYNDLLFPDPANDPNMEKALVTAATIAQSGGSLTINRPNPKSHNGSPKVALFAIAQHISDLDIAVNTIETTKPTLYEQSTAPTDTGGLWIDPTDPGPDPSTIGASVVIAQDTNGMIIPGKRAVITFDANGDPDDIILESI